MNQNTHFIQLCGFVLGLSLLACSNPAAEKAAREAEKEDGFHLSISTKDGDVKIDAGGNEAKESKKSNGGFHLDISTDGEKKQFNSEDLEEAFKDFDLNIKGNGKKLDAKVLRNLFPERIGWFKRSEYNFANALGLVSSAKVEYTKGNQKISVAILGGAIGNIAGSFGDLFEQEFENDDSNMSKKSGDWNGLHYVEGYDKTEEKAFMHMVIDKRITVIVGGENMSEWNFRWWWKRIDWKKLAQ